MRVGEPPKSVAKDASPPSLTNGYINILTFTLHPVSYLNSGGGVSNTQLGRGRKRHIHKGLVMGDDVGGKREERNLHT